MPADGRAPARQLILLSAAVLLGMSPWLATGAVAGAAALRWGLDAAAVAWLTTIVQLGFVAGTATAALLNLADVLDSRRFFTVSAVLAALANGTLSLAPGHETALVARFLTGFFLAGVYPPAMKMASTWFRERRGFAIGAVVGALTLGKATPYLAGLVPGAGLATVTLAVSAMACASAALVFRGYRDGPFAFPSRRFAWARVGDVARSRRWRAATGGYLGHMWELYAMWAFVPAFWSWVATTRGLDVRLGAFAGWATIAVGAAGCVVAGLHADRVGRARVATWAMVASGTCALLVGPLARGPLVLLALVTLVWGATVVADSAQFSALVTESVEGEAVGTALTLQTCLGFTLTMASMRLLPWWVERFGWETAFATLAIGPAVGVVALRGARARTTAGQGA